MTLAPFASTIPMTFQMVLTFGTHQHALSMAIFNCHIRTCQVISAMLFSKASNISRKICRTCVRMNLDICKRESKHDVITPIIINEESRDINKRVHKKKIQ